MNQNTSPQVYQNTSVKNSGRQTGRNVSTISEQSPNGVEILTWTITNATGAKAKYAIGSTKAIALMANFTGATYRDITSADVPVSVLKDSLSDGPISLSGMHIETSVGTAQFANKLKLFRCDLNGEGTSKSYSMSQLSTADQFNNKIKQFNFNPKKLPVLNWNQAFELSVEDGETVTLTAFVDEAGNRVATAL